jgi:hypothetical protein
MTTFQIQKKEKETQHHDLTLNRTCDGGAEEWLLSSLNIPSRLLQLAQQTKEESLGCFNNLKLYMGGS